ncbi:MAG: DUF4234 domain-containing protein [Candidatus Dormibacteria bacterium]|jgi:hypothetical protein
MTETASRPGTTPAVATLTAPETEGVAPTDTTATQPTWAWPLSVPPSHPPEGEVTTDSEDPVLDLTASPPPVETLEADPTEVTVVAAITTPEKALPKVTSFGPAGKRRSTLAIVVLSVLTLGIYSLVWYHRVNREVGNFDTRMHVIPGRSTAAVAIPWAIGWLVSIVGALRIVLAVANVALPFNPHFSVLQAYGLLLGGLAIPYLELLLPFSAVAAVMTLERVRIVEDRMGRTTDVQLRPTRVIFWMLLPIAGGLILMAITQRRLNRAWEDDMAAAPAVRPTVRMAPS